MTLPVGTNKCMDTSSLRIRASCHYTYVLGSLVSPFLLQEVGTRIIRDLPSGRRRILFYRLARCRQRLCRRCVRSRSIHTVLSKRGGVLTNVSLLQGVYGRPNLLGIGSRRLCKLARVRPPTSPSLGDNGLGILQAVLSR